MGEGVEERVGERVVEGVEERAGEGVEERSNRLDTVLNVDEITEKYELELGAGGVITGS